MITQSQSDYAPMLKVILAYFPAVIGAYVLGSVLATGVNLMRVESFGVPVTSRDRFDAIGHDLVGMAPTYLPCIAIVFLLAMPLGVLIGRYLDRWRFVAYGVSGAAALVALHLAARAALGFDALASVREPHGLLLQGVAGWCGAYLFYLFSGQAHR